MGNPLLGQILGAAFGHAMQRRGRAGMGAGMGGGLGGGLGGAAVGGILAGMLGRRGGGAGTGLGGRGAMAALLLPLVMRWVERNGGLGGVLKRFQDKGYRQQAASWVAPGDNQPVDPHAIDDVVGHQELQQLAQQAGVPEEDMKQAFAEILPEMVDQLTPQGQVPPEADQVLDEGRIEIEQELARLQQKDFSTS
jgi:uncharacterized protein YidB (DUF937 family)